jgi:methylthioribose-1-phosphate isomerase
MRAIQTMEIRGAPALGVAGAYGVALAARQSTARDLPGFLQEVQEQARALAATRPTAVNLSWGVHRVLARMATARDIPEAQSITLVEAHRIAQEDEEICLRIGAVGAALLPRVCTVLTHCNAGALACTRWGTALGVIRSAVAQGSKVRVFACETRPLFQGSRLTAWELKRDGIEVTVLADDAAATRMRRGEIDLVLVGADRITPDAVFNKIGTYMHAVCAKHHAIPFYVAAPLSTFDLEHTEEDVEVEERDREEIAFCGGRRLAPEGVVVKNEAFDATPISLVSGIITEAGIFYPPLEKARVLSAQRSI